MRRDFLSMPCWHNSIFFINGTAETAQGGGIRNSATTWSVPAKSTIWGLHWTFWGRKTSTALAMLMGPYKNVFSRVYVFSPSCAEGVDPLWDAWRTHVRIHMRVPDEEQTMWSTWEPQILEKLIERQKKGNAHLKAKKHKNVCNFSVG